MRLDREGVDIDRGLGHQLLDLPFADHVAATARGKSFRLELKQIC
jgi:hypothetical protein